MNLTHVTLEDCLNMQTMGFSAVINDGGISHFEERDDKWKKRDRTIGRSAPESV